MRRKQKHESNQGNTKAKAKRYQRGEISTRIGRRRRRSSGCVEPAKHGKQALFL